MLAKPLATLLVASPVAVAVIGLPTAARPTDTPPAKPAAREKTMDRAVERMSYGFRYDPMKYVETDASVPAAFVRAQVFGSPRDGASVRQTATITGGGTQMAAKVKREGGRVEIEGVPVMAWGKSCDTAFAGAMEAALAPTGHPYTATQVMGYTGLAFRVRWAGDPDNSKPGWCPSIPVGEFMEEQQAVAKATGWRFRIINEMDNEKDPRMGRYAGRHRSRHRRRPARRRLPEHVGPEPRRGRRLRGRRRGAQVPLAHLRHGREREAHRGGGHRPVGDGAAGLRRRAGRPAAPARRALHRRAQLEARQIAAPERISLRLGRTRALQSWQKDLARAATLSEDQQKQLFFADWWNYEAFQDARTRAAAFLKDEAPNLGDKGRDAVLRAAALYEQEGKLLVAQIEKPEGFLGPWSGKGFADWTPAVREREQQILAQALGLERQAIAEIEASLKAEGASAPEPTTEAAAPSSVRREDGKVWIEGLQEMNWGGSYFAHQDTFMACMTEILRCAGKDVTYAEVMGLSASAFKITMMENCHPGATQGHVGIAAWAPDGTPLVWEQGGETINFHSNAMRVFGITWSHIDLNPKDTPDWRKQLSAAVRASVDRGVPLFYMDGEWGLIVGYREDGSAFICKHEGMGSGYEEMERPRGVIGDVWWANTVVLDRPPVPRRQAMVDSLRSAALMWRAEGPEEGLYHGRSGYETWIRVLGDPGDDVMLHGNAFCYASLLTSRRAAAEYLRMVADELGGATAGHLGAAADAYESIADCLYAGRECVTWPWPEKWTPENRATETGILRQCMAEEAKAVAQIEAALHTLGEPVPAPVASNGRGPAPANVRHEDGKVWIEGMEGVNWGGSFFGREDSQARCLVEALRCAGQDVTYSDVMGLSGAAFKITMAPNLFVGEMHSEMGMDWKEIASRVWGLDYDWQAISMSDEENPNWREQLRQAAAESLGRGMPLFYMNGEWNLLVGYREDGSAFVCKPYAGEKPVYTESKIPGGFLGDAWFASVLRPAGKPADRRDSVLKSLRTAVELATHPAKKDGSRLFGPAAYEAWIAALEEDRKDASKHGNAFSYSQLLTSRRAAAEYLRKVADELGADAAPHLRTAADRYDAVAKRLDEGRDCVMWPWEENWTPENRGEEAAILRQCLADEKVAVSGIATALAALGETAPAPTADAGDAVLLQGAVADFKHIADDVAGHRLEVCARGADETLYPQPVLLPDDDARPDARGRVEGDGPRHAGGGLRRVGHVRLRGGRVRAEVRLPSPEPQRTGGRGHGLRDRGGADEDGRGRL